MEPIELARIAGVLFILAALSSALAIAVALIVTRPQRSTAPRSASQPLAVAPASPDVAAQGRAPRRSAPPPTAIPQLDENDAEAMSLEERSIVTAAKTMKELPDDLRRMLWAACVPHVFESSLLAALRPDMSGRLKDLYESVQRVWFVEVTPSGHYHLQAPIRRMMLRHMNKPDHYDEFVELSVRATKYFYQAMLGGAPHRRRFVTDAVYRFLPEAEVKPSPQIEWLYHLVVVDPDNAARALRQVGDQWLALQRYDLLQPLVDVLTEYLEDGRTIPLLRALIFYYQGCLALHQRRSPEALDLLEQARLQAGSDRILRDHILDAVGVGLEDLHEVQSGLRLSRASATQSAPQRRQWMMWDELQLPDPRQDLITRYEERLEHYRAQNYYAGMAQMMTLIAEEHVYRADRQAALQWYHDALRVCQEAAAVAGQPLLDEVVMRQRIGDTYAALRRYAEAQATYDVALTRISEIVGDGAPLLRADLIKAKADMQRQQGQNEEALPEYEAARQLYHDAGATSSEAGVLLAEGEAFYAQGNLSEAQQHFDDALQTYRAAGSRTGHAQTLLVLGGMTQQQGGYQDALQQYEQAREIYRREKNRSGEASALRAMGDAYVRLGKWDQALQAYREASEFYQAAGARAGWTHTLIAIGDVYRRQQAYNQAWPQYEQALQEFRTLHDVKGEADTLVAMAVVHSLQQRSDEALKLFDEAETLYRQASDRSGEAQARRFKGDEYLLEKKLELALTEFEEAVKVYQNYGGYHAALEELWGRVGHTLTMLGRKSEALSAYANAIAARSRVESGWHGYRALVEGQFDAADAHFTVVTRRDPDNAQWQIGLAMAKFGLAGDQSEAARRSAIVKEAAEVVALKLPLMNVAERAEACRWRDYVIGLQPNLHMHWGEFGLKCET